MLQGSAPTDLSPTMVTIKKNFSVPGISYRVQKMNFASQIALTIPFFLMTSVHFRAKISKIRDAVAWDATGLDFEKREMVPENQRLLADGGVAKTYCALDPMLTPLVVDC